MTRCSAHIETNLGCSVPYYSSYETMYLESCLGRTWSGGGQSVAETWSGGGQSVAETCTSRARQVSDNRDHYILFIPMEIIHSDERHE